MRRKSRWEGERRRVVACEESEETRRLRLSLNPNPNPNPHLRRERRDAEAARGSRPEGHQARRGGSSH